MSGMFDFVFVDINMILLWLVCCGLLFYWFFGEMLFS